MWCTIAGQWRKGGGAATACTPTLCAELETDRDVSLILDQQHAKSAVCR